jgi:hypothetical protein
VVTPGYEKIVVVGEDDLLVLFCIGRNFRIGRVVLENVLDGRHCKIVGGFERLDVLRRDVLVAENPHLFRRATLGSDRLLSGLFLCTERLPATWLPAPDRVSAEDTAPSLRWYPFRARRFDELAAYLQEQAKSFESTALYQGGKAHPVLDIGPSQASMEIRADGRGLSVLETELTGDAIVEAFAKMAPDLLGDKWGGREGDHRRARRRERAHRHGREPRECRPSARHRQRIIRGVAPFVNRATDNRDKSVLNRNSSTTRGDCDHGFCSQITAEMRAVQENEAPYFVVS